MGSAYDSVRKLFNRYVAPTYRHKKFNPEALTVIKSVKRWEYYGYEHDGVCISREPRGNFFYHCDLHPPISEYIVEVDGVTIFTKTVHSTHE